MIKYKQLMVYRQPWLNGVKWQAIRHGSVQCEPYIMDLNAVIIVIAKTNDKQFAGTVLSYWLQYIDSAIGLLLNNFK